MNGIIHWWLEGLQQSRGVRDAKCWHRHRADSIHKRDMHLEGHQTAHEAKIIGSICRTGRSGCVADTGKHTHTQERPRGKQCLLGTRSFSELCSQHSTREFKSFQHPETSNQFTADSPRTFWKSVHSYALQLHASDLEICLSTSCVIQSTALRKKIRSDPCFSNSLCLPAVCRRVERFIHNEIWSLVSGAPAWGAQRLRPFLSEMSTDRCDKQSWSWGQSVWWRWGMSERFNKYANKKSPHSDEQKGSVNLQLSDVEVKGIQRNKSTGASGPLCS